MMSKLSDQQFDIKSCELFINVQLLNLKLICLSVVLLPAIQHVALMDTSSLSVKDCTI